MWGSEPSHSQSNSHLGDGVPVDSRIFRGKLHGLKLNGLKSSLYNWKSLGSRCLKWVCIAHLHIWNTSYGQKKGWEPNWQFDSWPLKVRNQFDFLVCRWRATNRWKYLDEAYNFAFDLISIRGLLAKLWRSKVARVPTLAISGLSLRSPGTKSHLMWASWRSVEYTIMEKVVTSPKSRPWWVLCVRVTHGSS